MMSLFIKIFKERFEDIKGVNKSRKSKKDRQYYDLKIDNTMT